MADGGTVLRQTDQQTIAEIERDRKAHLPRVQEVFVLSVREARLGVSN